MTYSDMIFIETPIFTRAIRKLLPDDDYRELQQALVLRPEAGDIIPGSGGLRKIRWGILGSGKRGGLRLIYYWAIPMDTIVYASDLQEEQAGRSYPKSTQATAYPCKGVASMNKNDFADLVESVKQAGQIRRGELKPCRTFEISPLDVKTIRMNLRKSQNEFAVMIGVSVSTLRNWEQGRRRPEGPARVLLKVASETPEVIVKALRA